MINKFYRDYQTQYCAWRREKEILKENTNELKALSKNQQLVQGRLLRTAISLTDAEKAQPGGRTKPYGFDAQTFKQYLMIYDAVLPSIITQTNEGDFVLMFATENQRDAFLECTLSLSLCLSLIV